MISPEPNETGKVSLEDVLRLKRAERPELEFWARFEQDLRAKQLAAIMEKRPWWVALRLPQATRALAQWPVHLPLGAAVVLALSFVVVREDRAHSVSTPVARTEGAVKIATAPALKAAREVLAAVAVVPAGSVAPWASVQERVPAPAAFARLGAALAQATPTLPAITVTASAEPAAAAEQVALVGSAPSSVMGDWVAESPGLTVAGVELSRVAFDSIGATVATAGFDSRLGTETEGMSEGGPIRAGVGANRAAPTSPREVRRGRILASLVADNATDGHRFTPGYVREVLASTLSDAKGFDNVSRVGMGGDRLTLKF